jgi:hypothetical protein
MTPEEREAKLKELIAAGLTFSDCTHAFGSDEFDSYVQAARLHVREGELEVDTPAVVSRGADDGAYVMAWIWIDNQEAGISPAEDMAL